MSLNLDSVAKGSSTAGAEKELWGDDCQLTVTAPSGEALGPFTLKTGITVDYVKSLVEKESGLDFTSFMLEKDGAPLPDPMSLVDVGIQAGSKHTLVVKMLD